MRAPQFHGSGRRKGKAPGEQFVKHNTHRVDVAANAGFAPVNLLRSHVGQRTGNFVPARGIVAAQGQAKVRDAHPASAIEHDIGGFQIAMEKCRESCAAARPAHSLVRRLQSLVGGQAPDAAQQRCQILAVDVLHGEKVLALHLADVVDAADIWMRNLAGVANFAWRAARAAASFWSAAGRNLRATTLTELDILGAIDFAHAAAAQQGHDPVSFRQHCAWRESSLSEGRRTWGSAPGAATVGSGAWVAASRTCTAWPQEEQKSAFRAQAA